MEMNKIEEFIEKKDGRATYKSWLKKYFKIVKKNPDKYFDSNQDYDTDIIEFARAIESWAPATKKGAISCLKTFFQFNNIRLQPKTEYKLKEYQKGPKAVSQEKVPTRKELKEILSFGKVTHKALFLTMASSGLRPGETVSITFNDIHLDETPVRIEVPYGSTRTKEARNTFISSEAKHWLNQWLKIRDTYVKSSRNKVKTNDNRIFPMSDVTLRDMWIGLITKAGYDVLDNNNGKNRQRYQMTPQKLRKFFKTSMSDAGIPFEIYEALMGHKQGVEAVYRGYSLNQLKDWYLKGESSLLIFEKPVNQEELDVLTKQVQSIQNQLTSILEFQEKVASVPVEDDEGCPVIKDGEIVTEINKDIPKEAITEAFRLEQQRKKDKAYQKLVDEFGEETAKKIWKMKSQ